MIYMLTNIFVNNITKHIAEKKCLKILRKDISETPLYGIPLLISDDFLLLSYECDFLLDGYIVICNKDISDIITDERINYKNYILEKEGVLNKIVNHDITDLSNYHIIFNQLSSRNIIIECEKDEKFFLGKPKIIADDYLDFLCIDDLGNLKNECDRIYFNDISLITFDDRYTRYISKYYWDKKEGGFELLQQG